MSRIESLALEAVESERAVEQIAESTKRLVERQIRFARYVVTRKGGDGSRLHDSEALRKKLQEGIQRQVELNRIE